ncbi:transglutaminase-like domain-containing protein [Corynebacterium comes]|uniref:Transglutaminase-like superfamily protein n=1 Tax=Corynebacterium comes TaxID=2675218 RepID=A0A6B8W081_9CORY|nr:transglutaminase family protein [Corynebacterium comes]QGU04725.1 Transglutaminase-like superfamily protein [Corynebacterium comes]
MHLDAEFLSPTTFIDADHPDIIALAAALAGDTPAETVRNIFVFVRDRITHPADTGGTHVAVSASDALRTREGLSYAQAHLLVALYRAAGIPAALRYQQVQAASGALVLRGVATVWAPGLSGTGGFLLVDPRYPENHPRHSGNFWQTRALQPPFERNLPMIHTDVAPAVAGILTRATDAQSLLRAGVPGTL